MPPVKNDCKENLEEDITEVSDDTKESNEDSSNNQSKIEADNEEKTLEIDSGTENANKLEGVEIEKDAKQEKEEKENQAGGNKRISSESEDSSKNVTPAKKSRPKPKPLTIDNMKEYVENNTIEKLTNTTLFHWLKERNLHCSTRDKKVDLIQKIKNHFATTTS